MHATLRSARIAPKKANLIAALVRRMPVEGALHLLERLPKKGARMLHVLITSAAANASHNASQESKNLFVKTLVVQKGSAFRRSIPMARGRSRPIDKWTSHITVELGVLVPGQVAASPKKTPEPSPSHIATPVAERPGAKHGAPAGDRDRTPRRSKKDPPPSFHTPRRASGRGS